MVGKFGLRDVFIVVKEKEHEPSYHLDAINEFNNSEVEATRK